MDIKIISHKFLHLLEPRDRAGVQQLSAHCAVCRNVPQYGQIGVTHVPLGEDSACIDALQHRLENGISKVVAWY